MFVAYVIENVISEKRYVGYTADLLRRLKEHNSLNRTKYAGRFSGTWRVIYKETVESKVEAMAREKYLKSHAGRRFVARRLEKGL